MLVNDVAINRNILEEFLVLLPNQTRDSFVLFTLYAQRPAVEVGFFSFVGSE